MKASLDETKIMLIVTVIVIVIVIVTVTVLVMVIVTILQCVLADTIMIVMLVNTNVTAAIVSWM